jgi:hypothetical protein
VPGGLTVADHETLSLTIDVDSVAENAGANAATGTVTRNNTDTGAALVVTLTSSDESEATVASSVTIPAGSTSASFVIAAIDDGLLDGTQTVTITATADGFVSAAETLDVNDHEPLTVTISRTTVLESEGDHAATGTVTRGNGDYSAPLTVTLTSDDDTEATVPATVTIGGGEASATFAVNAVDDGFSDPMQTVVIVASALGYQSGSATLNVADGNTLTWQNPNNRFDVDNSGDVTALDVLILINEINAHSARKLPDPLPPDLPPPFLDVNGDGTIAPLDVLAVINAINSARVGEGEGEVSGRMPTAMGPIVVFEEASPAAPRPTLGSAPRMGAKMAATESSNSRTRVADESPHAPARRLAEADDNTPHIDDVICSRLFFSVPNGAESGPRT